ncbi:MAG: radical SAM protein [Sedimentisphaerales bacterium]|nr:radical SAM protein [Sedimentisphaerales bacterium]
MRSVLVFSPFASPTYTPLGIATLSSFIKATYPQCHLNAVDLNIATWNWLIDRKKEYQPFRDFVQGKQKDFFDETQYRTYQPVWKQLMETNDGYIRMARLYLEQNILDDELQKLLEFYASLVLANDPELIGFSIMYPRQVLLSLAIAKFLNSALSMPGRNRPMIVMDGATISALNGQEILNACPFVDAVFEGEGEAGLGMLCTGRSFCNIPGLSYRGTAGILTNRKTDTISLNKVPLPDFSELNLSSYFNPEPVVPLIFSRGCKWRKCRFCAHNFSYSGYRSRNASQFVEHLQKLNRQLGVRHFYLADQYVDATDMEVLAEEILNQGLKIYFHIMGRPTADYTPEVLQKLFAAGCRWISWGIESGSQRLLDISLKGTSAQTIRRIIKDSHQAGISNLLMMIFGLPTGTDEDFDATMDLLDDLVDSTDAMTASSFQLFDRTAFAAQAKTFSLEITGREILFSSEHGTVHSNRLFYREKDKDGTTRPPRGPLELNRLERRRLWSRQDSIFQYLTCEHYLLYASRSTIRNGLDATTYNIIK